jgi:hypothetical protein
VQDHEHLIKLKSLAIKKSRLKMFFNRLKKGEMRMSAAQSSLKQLRILDVYPDVKRNKHTGFLLFIFFTSINVMNKKPGIIHLKRMDDAGF